MADKRSALKPGQITILELLYKYRFGSRQLVAESLSIKAGSSLHEKINVLIKHGLVGKRLDPKQRMANIPAAYYLTPTGLRTLQALPNHEYITDAVIKSSYKDVSVGQPFISHTLEVYRFVNALSHQYPGLKAYLRRDMARYSYFPENPPDAFLSLKTGEVTRLFFLDVIAESTPRYIIERRVAGYGTFFDEGSWDVTGSEPPMLLFITEKGTTETRTRHGAQAALRRLDLDEEIEVYTTTYGALINLTEPTSIWTSMEDPDELVFLTDI